MPRAHVVFAELSRLLGGAPYFAGGSLSLADLMVAPHLACFASTPEWGPLTAGRENLAGFLQRMDARPSFQATTWDAVAAMATAA
jgi:glutathione S-transferase